MDYEKKYKEALERAKEYVAEYDFEEAVKEIFPELKEDGDEKIRKELIFYLGDMPEDTELRNGVTNRDVLVWLEKQGEQKPQRIVSAEAKQSLLHDKYEGLTDFERTLADICFGWIGEELGWEQYIKDNADVLLRIAVEKFNSVQDAPFEQKPAWTKEDERKIQDCIDAVSHVNLFKVYYQNELVEWLKSLKDRYTWKPSDEQIRPLEYAIDYFKKKNNDTVYLESLYNDLKKLREE